MINVIIPKMKCPNCGRVFNPKLDSPADVMFHQEKKCIIHAVSEVKDE